MRVLILTHSAYTFRTKSKDKTLVYYRLIIFVI